MSLHNEVLKPETRTCTPPGKYCIPKETHPNLLHRRGLRFIKEFTNQFPNKNENGSGQVMIVGNK